MTWSDDEDVSSSYCPPSEIETSCTEFVNTPRTHRPHAKVRYADDFPLSRNRNDAVRVHEQQSSRRRFYNQPQYRANLDRSRLREDSSGKSVRSTRRRARNRDLSDDQSAENSEYEQPYDYFTDTRNRSAVVSGRHEQNQSSSGESSSQQSNDDSSEIEYDYGQSSSESISVQIEDNCSQSSPNWDSSSSNIRRSKSDVKQLRKRGSSCSSSRGRDQQCSGSRMSSSASERRSSVSECDYLESSSHASSSGSKRRKSMRDDSSQKSGNSRASGSKRMRSVDSLGKPGLSRSKSTSKDLIGAKSGKKAIEGSASVDGSVLSDPSGGVRQRDHHQKLRRSSLDKMTSVPPRPTRKEKPVCGMLKFSAILIFVLSCSIVMCMAILRFNGPEAFDAPAVLVAPDTNVAETVISFDEYIITIFSKSQPISRILLTFDDRDEAIIDHRFLLTPGLTEKLAEKLTKGPEFLSNFIFLDETSVTLITTTAYFKPVVDIVPKIRFRNSEIIADVSMIRFWCQSEEQVSKFLIDRAISGAQTLHVVLDLNFEGRSCLRFVRSEADAFPAVYKKKSVPDLAYEPIMSKDVSYGGTFCIFSQKLSFSAYQELLEFTGRDPINLRTLRELLLPGNWEDLARYEIEDEIVCWLGIYPDAGGFSSLTNLQDKICPDSVDVFFSDLSETQAKIFIGLKVTKSEGSSCLVLHEPTNLGLDNVQHYIAYWVND